MKRVLSIDDEPSILKCFKDVLEMRGYSVRTTTDPDEGIAILRAEPHFDLLLLDVKMPRKNGFEVYREIRTFNRVPVLFVTAYPKSFTAKSDDVVTMWQEQFADGTTDILYKPFPMESLFSKVEALIGLAEESSSPS